MTQVVDAPRLEIRRVTKVFKSPKGEQLTALDDVSLEVQPGEFITIVGPSGCGKTTLLRIIQGLDSSTSGDIRLNTGSALQPEGQTNSGRMGFVFQKPSLLPWRTVEDNVSFGLDLAAGKEAAPNAKERASTVRQLLELTGLEQFAGYYPSQISGGMQQRVNLARALAINPEVLLMDEPFSALDAQTRERLQRELLRVVGALNTTVIFITHDIREAVFLADRVVVLTGRPGRIDDVLCVEEPRPRAVEFQQSARMAKRSQEIWSLLHADEDDD